MPCLRQNGAYVTDPLVTSDILEQHFATVSSNQSYIPTFLNIKNRIEREHLYFNTPNQHNYNLPITRVELQEATRRAKKTAPGMDEIHYSMIKHIADSTTAFLLHIYNRVWLEGVFHRNGENLSCCHS